MELRKLHPTNIKKAIMFFMIVLLFIQVAVAGFFEGGDRTTIIEACWLNLSQYLNVSQLDDRYLYKENTYPFTPDADYEPATKKYVDDNAGGGSSITYTLNTEYFNGSTSTIILNNSNTSRNENVYLNGMLMLLNTDYSMNHNAANSNVTFLINVVVNDNIVIDYFTTSNTTSSYNSETKTGSQILPSKRFTLANSVLSKNEQVYANGMRLTLDTDYNVTHQSSNSYVDFEIQINAGEILIINYYT